MEERHGPLNYDHVPLQTGFPMLSTSMILMSYVILCQAVQASHTKSMTHKSFRTIQFLGRILDPIKRIESLQTLCKDTCSARDLIWSRHSAPQIPRTWHVDWDFLVVWTYPQVELYWLLCRTKRTSPSGCSKRP